jgi:hypothetical protein
MIASPSDTAAERAAISEVVAQWNADHAENTHVVLLPVMWERNAVSEVGAVPQDSINRQIVERSDILVGVFWARIGTATKASASGTVEEIERFVDAGKPAALFFSNRPVEPRTVDPDQLKALQEFKLAMRDRSLYFEYGELPELRTRVSSYLTQIIREREGADIERADERPVANRRANLVAQVTSEQRVRAGTIPIRDWYIVVANNGLGPARNVSVELESTNTGEQPWDILDADPVDHLASSSTFRFPILVVAESTRRCNATLRWVNEDGSEGISRQTLTL